MLLAPLASAVLHGGPPLPLCGFGSLVGTPLERGYVVGTKFCDSAEMWDGGDVG